MNTNSGNWLKRILASPLTYKLWLPNLVGVALLLAVVWGFVALYGAGGGLMQSALAATVMAVVGILVLGWLISVNVIRPLRKLRDGTATLAGGQLAYRIDIHSGDELEGLSSEFNRMATSLQHGQQQLAAFAQDKIHQAEEAQVRLRELTLIAETSRTISASLDLQTILDTILSSVRQIVPYDLAQVCLWDPEERVLRTSARGANPQYATYLRPEGDVYKLDEGLTGWIARNGAPLLVNDLWEETRAAPKLARSELPIRAYVGAPLMVGQELVGALELPVMLPVRSHKPV